MHISLDLLPASERGHHTLEGRESLSFGKLRSDHMLLIDYDGGAWHDARILPYGPISLMPGASVLHYGQAIFEGMKVFRHADGEIYAFRPEKNAERFNISARIMCMAEIPVGMHMDGLMHLLDIERKWCPTLPEASLYVRPFMFATEDGLGVKPSDSYIFSVILSPSGPYYAGGFDHTVSLLISHQFHRAVSGGTGAAKCAGNYAGSLRAALTAKALGAAQVLYLDASNTYIEEAGAMNHFHVRKDGTFVIPEFTDSILRSITSESVMELLPRLGYSVRQERIKLEDFVEDVRSGEIVEAGGLGTAAVITPVSTYLLEDGSQITVGDGTIGEHTRRLYDAYTAIQTGNAEDIFGWLTKVPRLA